MKAFLLRWMLITIGAIVLGFAVIGFINFVQWVAPYVTQLPEWSKWLLIGLVISLWGTAMSY